jgi:hypothetical protein
VSEPSEFEEYAEAGTASIRAAIDQQKHAQEVFTQSFDRLLIEELDLDQVETIITMLSLIANADSPFRAVIFANYLEGTAKGILRTRKALSDTALFPPDDLTAFSSESETHEAEHFHCHPFEISPDLPPYCGVCNLPREAQPHWAYWAQKAHGFLPVPGSPYCAICHGPIGEKIHV